MTRPASPSRFRRLSTTAALSVAALLAWAACAHAEVSANPQSVSFGVQALGSRSAEQPVTVFDSGADPTTVTASITGRDALEFAVVSDGCRGMTLQAGGSCELTVVFRPVTRRAKAAALLIQSSAGAMSVPLAGNPRAESPAACGAGGQPPCDPRAACAVPRLPGLSDSRARGALRRARCRTGRVTRPRCRPGRRCRYVVSRQALRPGTVKPTATAVAFSETVRA